MDHSITKEEVNDFLKKWVASYESGSPKFFGFFAPDASVFALSSPVRIDGRDEYKRTFEEHLGAKTARKSQLLTPEIRIMGSAAVVTYHNRVKVGDTVTHTRTTVVLSKDKQGDIRIEHMHSSPLVMGVSVATAAAGPQAVALHEERVATAIAAVGTPR